MLQTQLLPSVVENKTLSKKKKMLKSHKSFKIQPQQRSEP